MKTETQKRIESFCWRILMIMIAAGIDGFLSNIGLLNITGEFTVILGLILGEVSKAIRNQYATRLP